MQFGWETKEMLRVGIEGGQPSKNFITEWDPPSINQALLLPRLSKECQDQIVGLQTALPVFDASQWAMVERCLIEQGTSPAFTGNLSRECIERTYKNLLHFLIPNEVNESHTDVAQTLNHYECEVSYTDAPFNSCLEVKIERFDFGFTCLDALYAGLGSVFVKALSLIDIALFDILPSEIYCEYAGHFWPLNECSEETLNAGFEAVNKELNEFYDEEDCSDLNEMYERRMTITKRRDEIVSEWCSASRLFTVIEEVEIACKEPTCRISEWCLNVTKAIRDEFRNQIEFDHWYESNPGYEGDGNAPIVALFDDWECEREAYQMAFEAGEMGQTYLIKSSKDIQALKRVCDLKRIGGELLTKAVILSDELNENAGEVKE